MCARLVNNCSVTYRIDWVEVDSEEIFGLDIVVRLVYDIFFFFSSRRRHTRFDCDWSSDVCSSDLIRDVPKGWKRTVDCVLNRVRLSPDNRWLVVGCNVRGDLAVYQWDEGQSPKP